MSLDPVIYQEHMESVKSNWLNLYQVHEEYQTDELCMIAINQSGYAIKFVKNQREEICLAAVGDEGLALEYVGNQTPEICLFALSRDPSCLFCVRDLSSIALLLDDEFIEGNIRIHPEYEEIKVIKARMLMTQLASDSINSNDVMTNNRKSKAGI